MNNYIVKGTLLLSSTLTIMSGAIVAPALPSISKYFSEESVDPLLVRLIITMPALMIAFFSPSFGKLIDRYGRKKPLLSGFILYGFSGTAGFYLDNIYFILLSRMFLGVSIAAIMNSITTLVGDYFEGEERNAFMGFQSAFMAMGGMIFVTFGGFIADINWRWTFLMYGFSFLLIPPASSYLDDRFGKSKKEKQKADSSKSKVDTISVYSIYIMGFFGMAFFYLVPVQIPFYIQSIGVEGNMYGGLSIGVTTLFAGLASLSFSWLKRRYSFQALIGINYLIMATGCLLVSFSGSFTVLIISLSIFGLGAGLIMPGANLWLMSIVPAEFRGKFVGGLTASFFTGQFLSPILADPIIEMSSIGSLFFFASIFMFLISLFWFSGLFKKLSPA